MGIHGALGAGLGLQGTISGSSSGARILKPTLGDIISLDTCVARELEGVASSGYESC
jgi:hypothetical protein